MASSGKKGTDDSAEAAPAEDGAVKLRSMGLRGLFMYADRWDCCASLLAIVCLAGLGVTTVAFLVFLRPFFVDVSAASSADGGLPMDTVNFMATMIILLGAGQFFISVPGFAAANISAARQKREWQKSVVKSIVRQEVGWFDTTNPEQLTSKVASSIALIMRGLSGPTYGMFMALAAVVFGITGGLIENAQIALVVLACTPILAVAVAMLAYVMVTGGKRGSRAYAKAGGIATEALFAMRTIAALGLESVFIDKYSANLANAKAVTISSRCKLGLATGILFGAFIILQGGGFLYGGILFSDELDASSYDYSVTRTFEVPTGSPTMPFTNVTAEIFYCAHANNTPANVSINAPCSETFRDLRALRMNCQMANLLELFDQADGGAFGTNMSMLDFVGQDSWDDLRRHSQEQAPPSYIDDNPLYWACSLDGAIILICVMYVVQGAMGLGQAAQPIQQLGSALPASDLLLSIISRVSSIDSFSDAGTKLDKVNGDIEVKAVVFAYPSAAQHLVCNGYSLSIAAGQMVALSGASGSGKSTIIQLIERFYDPLDGVIKIDGVDIKSLNVRWLRDQIGLVGQEPVLFQGSVAENIKYGKRDATQAEVEDAAKMANAHEFISTILNDGYSTQVGQGGGKLSGGQKQRVAIARAIIKKPSILLLDEATSALDNESERIVQAALDEIMTKQKRTTLVIAHRLSTIRNADKIAVVDKGAVVEQGTYDELLAIGGEGFFFKLAKKQEELGAQDLKTMNAKRGLVDGAPVPAPAAAKEAKTEVVVAKVEKVVAEEKKEKKKAEKPPVGRLFALQRESAPFFIAGTLFAAGSGGVPLYGFYIMLNLFSVFFQLDGTTIREETIHYALLLFGTIGIVIFCFWADTASFGVSAARLTYKLRRLGFMAFVGQDIGFFDTEAHSAGSLTAFLSEKVTIIEFLTGGQMQAMIRALACICAMIVFSFAFGSWQITLYMMAAFPLMGVLMSCVLMAAAGDQLREQQGKEKTGKAAVADKEAGQLIAEVVLAIRTVASFNAEHHIVADYNKQVDRVAKLETVGGAKSAIALGLGTSLFMCMMGGMNYYGGYLISLGAITFQEMMTPMFMMMGGMTIMIGAFMGIKDMATAQAAAKLFFEAIDRKPAIDVFGTDGTKLDKVNGDIEVKAVVFAYPSAAQHLVCNGYSLSIAAGQTVALSGASGSGKSTIIQLIERFYDPIDGCITIDGVDIKTLNVPWLRSQLGLVSQEPVLFQGSVAENIKYGKLDAMQAEVEDAAKMANAHEFVMGSLADGYATEVGMRGGKLSGGQKQRVAIARALVRKPSILLLDEATSALDNESERIVQAALDEIMTKQKRTTLVIAHRLSTIRNADNIAVLKEGKVAEQGTHDELLANPEGLYFNLVLAQSS